MYANCYYGHDLSCIVSTKLSGHIDSDLLALQDCPFPYEIINQILAACDEDYRVRHNLSLINKWFHRHGQYLVVKTNAASSSVTGDKKATMYEMRRVDQINRHISRCHNITHVVSLRDEIPDSVLCRLPNIISLVTDRNYETGCPLLRKLYLDRVKITGPLKSDLRELGLFNCPDITDKDLVGLTKLKRLVVDGTCDLTKLPQSVEELHVLRYSDMNNETLAGFTGLKKLTIDNHSIDNLGSAGCTELEHLVINKRACSMFAGVTLRDFKKLKYIDLGDCRGVYVDDVLGFTDTTIIRLELINGHPWRKCLQVPFKCCGSWDTCGEVTVGDIRSWYERTGPWEDNEFNWSRKHGWSAHGLDYDDMLAEDEDNVNRCYSELLGVPHNYDSDDNCDGNCDDLYDRDYPSGGYGTPSYEFNCAMCRGECEENDYSGSDDYEAESECLWDSAEPEETEYLEDLCPGLPYWFIMEGPALVTEKEVRAVKTARTRRGRVARPVVRSNKLRKLKSSVRRNLKN